MVSDSACRLEETIKLFTQLTEYQQKQVIGLMEVLVLANVPSSPLAFLHDNNYRLDEVKGKDF